MTNLKYDKPEVQLSGEDDNVFSIIARCSKALRKTAVAIGPLYLIWRML